MGLHDKLEPSFQVVYTKILPTLSGKFMSDPSHILYEENSFCHLTEVAYARLNWLCYANLLWVLSLSELWVQIWKIQKTHYSNAL